MFANTCKICTYLTTRPNIVDPKKGKKDRQVFEVVFSVMAPIHTFPIVHRRASAKHILIIGLYPMRFRRTAYVDRMWDGRKVVFLCFLVRCEPSMSKNVIKNHDL